MERYKKPVNRSIKTLVISKETHLTLTIFAHTKKLSLIDATERLINFGIGTWNKEQLEAHDQKRPIEKLKILDD